MKISFNNSKDQTLVGILERPQGEGPHPLAIICHGFTATKDMHFYPVLAQRLLTAGYATLLFDFTGNGESEGKFEQGNLLQEIEDVKSALDFAAGEGFENICLVGHSMGGVVCMKAGTDERVKKVAMVSPGISYDNYINIRFREQLPELNSKGYFMFSAFLANGLIKQFKITKEFMDVRKSLDVNAEVAKLDKPKLMTFGAIDGPACIPEDIQKFFESATDPKYIEIIEGADHNYTGKEAELADAVVEFAKR